MSLSKSEITRLIHKRRKKSLYTIIESLQNQAWDSKWDRRYSPFAHIEHYWFPHLNYVDTPTKQIPAWVYQDWFEFSISHHGQHHTLHVHPRDHEWVLSQLLK